MNEKDLSKVLAEKQWRDMPLDRAAINEKDRTVSCSFAAGANVVRWWGIEHLNMAPESVKMQRWMDNPPFLMDHNTEDQRGVIINGRLENGVLRGDVKLSRSDDGEELMQDMADGIRTKTSVGYMVLKVNEIKPEQMTEEQRQLALENSMPVYDVVLWEPYEGSSVAVQADTKVGVGRAQAPAAQAPEVPDVSRQISDEVQKQLSNITLSRGGVIMEEKTKEQIEKEQKENEQRKLQLEEERKTEINAIASRFADRVPNAKRYAEDAIKLGVTLEEFRGTIYNKVTDDKPLENDDIGMTEKDQKRYSLFRLLRSVTDPTNKEAREAAKFEFECSEAARAKKEIVRGVATIPNDVLIYSHRRDLITGTDTIGGNLVQTTVSGANFIEVLRAKMVFGPLGARYLTGLTGNFSLPSQTSATTAYWPGENTAPTEGAPKYGQLALTPKTVGAFVDIGRRLLIQSSIDLEALVRSDLYLGLTAAMEVAAINGTTTSSTYNGILNTSGIGTTTGGGNGAAPTWANILEMESDVATANAETGSLAYLTNPVTRGKLKQVLKVSTAANSDFLWDTRAGNTPVNGYPCAVTSNVPSTLTKGTTTTCSAIIYGNFADCVFGIWGNGIDILVDPFTGSAAGTTRVRALADVDFGLRHVLSFSAMPDCISA